MPIFVYILECNDGKYYTCITWNIEKRLLEHNSGNNISTKAKLPLKLVYWKGYNNRVEAAKREREIKGWNRIKKRKLIDSLH